MKNWTGSNIDCLTDSPTDIIKQLNELNVAGCKLIRWQLVNDPKVMAGWSVGQYRWWLNNRLWVLDQCIPTLLANGQPIILTFHHSIGGFKDNKWQLFHHEELLEEFYLIWNETVARYKENNAVFAFEPINEPFPNTQAQLQEFYCRCASILRSHTQKHMVIAHATSDCDKMKSLRPIPFNNVWYSYHFYKPASVLQKDGRAFKPSKKSIREALEPVIKWEKKYKSQLVATNSRMLCGEFGCLAASGKGKNQEPWIRLTKEVLNELGHDWLWLGHSYYDKTFALSETQFNTLWR